MAIALPENQIHPDLSGNRLAFESNGNRYFHIIGGVTEQIIDHIRDQILPCIDQDMIVRQGSRYRDPSRMLNFGARMSPLWLRE